MVMGSYDSGALASMDVDVGRMRMAQYAGFQVSNLTPQSEDECIE